MRRLMPANSRPARDYLQVTGETMMLSNQAQDILRAVGWNPGRCVPTEHWTTLLSREGFQMLPEATLHLSELGGLEIVGKRLPESLRPGCNMLFNPELAASGEFDRVEYWEQRLGLRLSPIAEVDGGILLLGADGRAWVCFCNLLFVAGNSFDEAIENLLVNRGQKLVEFGRMT